MPHLLTPKKLIISFVLIMLTVALYFYLSVFMPIILGFLTALILEPLVKSIQKTLRFKKRLPAVIIVFTLFVCFTITIFYLTITKLINEAIKFIDRLPYYIVEITMFIDRLLVKINEAVAGLPANLIIELENELDRQSETVIERGKEIAEQTIPMLVSGAQAIPQLIVVTLIFLITLFLFSMDLPRIIEGFYNHFKAETKEKVRYMTQRLSYVFVGFWKAQFLVSIIIFIVSYLGLLLILPKNALLMAALIWIIDFIPVIGSIIILSPWALFHLLSGNTVIGVQLLLLAGVLLILRRTLEPKIMGAHIGLSSLATLIAIYLGFYFFGIIGLIVGPFIIIAFTSAKEAGIIKTDFKL